MAQDSIIPVAAGILVNDGKFLLARRKEGSSNSLKWEFPGGRIEEGETPNQALEREIQEELGISIEAGIEFCQYSHDYPDKKIHLYFIFAEPSQTKFTLFCHEAAIWVSPEELKNYDICDADIPAAEKLAALKGIKQ